MSLKIYTKIRFVGHFFLFVCLFVFFLAFSSLIYRPVHLFNASCGLKVLNEKGLIKKFI